MDSNTKIEDASERMRTRGVAGIVQKHVRAHHNSTPREKDEAREASNSIRAQIRAQLVESIDENGEETAGIQKDGERVKMQMKSTRDSQPQARTEGREGRQKTRGQNISLFRKAAKQTMCRA